MTKIIDISVCSLERNISSALPDFTACGSNFTVLIRGHISATMSRGTTAVSGDIKVEKSKMKWDPKTLEIRTHSVEKTLEPLVHQVRFRCLDMHVYLVVQSRVLRKKFRIIRTRYL